MITFERCSYADRFDGDVPELRLDATNAVLDPRTMLPRLNKLLELALKVESVPVETEPMSRTDALEKGEARKEASEAMDK
mgnify:CR=1 FL=1